MVLQIARPRPIPWDLVVTNGSNTLPLSVSEMPGPESSTSITAMLSSVFVLMVKARVPSGTLERVWEICSSCFRCVIQVLDVDRAESWPDGEDCQEDEALPI